MALLRILACLLIFAIVGCSDGFESVEVKPPPAAPAAQNAKTVLQEVAQTGQLGSGMMTLRENLEQVKQSDAAKGDALLADLGALESLTDAEAIKAKAKEMADKL